MIFSAAESSSNRFHMYFPNADSISVYDHGSWYMSTSALARDPSAWMHLVFACDTTQSTATDRFKVYSNGVLADSFSARVNPPQYRDIPVNSAILHQISGRGYNTSDHFDGQLADVHFIDGQALAPTDFGEFDSNNVWQPKEYSGTYGTNGFHLDFSDNSSNAALGTDSSGNSNTWTVNNLDIISAVSTVSSGNAYSAGWAGLGTDTWANSDSWSGLSAVSNNAKGYFSSTENLSNGTVISVANSSFAAGSEGSNGWVLRASSIVKLDLTVYPNITEIATTNSDSQTFANRTVVATNPSSGSTLTVTGKCIWFKTTSQMSVSTMGTVNNAAGGAVTAVSYTHLTLPTT